GAGDATAHAVALAGGGREIPERRAQPARLEMQGREAARHAARVRERTVQEIPDATHPAHRLLADRPEVRLHRVAQVGDRRQLLAEVVVQVLPDAALLDLRDPEHFVLETLPLDDLRAQGG